MHFLKKKSRSRSGGRSAAGSDDSHSPTNNLSMDESMEALMCSTWDLPVGESYQNGSLQLSHENYDYTSVRIHNKASMARITVVGNMPIPAAQLKKVSLSRQARGVPNLHNHSSSPGHPPTTRSAAPNLSNLFSAHIPPSASSRTASAPVGLYPQVQKSARNINSLDRQQEESILEMLHRESLYYFEVTTQALPAGCDACVGLVLDKVGSSAGQFIPGETRDSIGLDSTGVLRVSGKVIEPESVQIDSSIGRIEGFGEGDVIGCAVEISGPRRVFFTKNGRIIVPPTRFTDLEMKKVLLSPALGLKVLRNQTVLAEGNFGMDPRKPFIWGRPAYLAYQPSDGGSTTASSSHGQRTRENHQQRSHPSTPPTSFRAQPIKPPNRQQSAPTGPPAVQASPRSPRSQRSAGMLRQHADRQSASLSPAAGLYQRNRRPGEKRNAPTIDTARRDSEDVLGSRAHESLLDDAISSHLGLIDRPYASSSAMDAVMSASTSRLDSEWQTGGDSHDDGSAFVSTTSGARSTLEFAAICENEDIPKQDPFAAPEANHSSGSVGHPREEEKTAIEDMSERDCFAAPAGTLTPNEIELMRENVRMLRSVGGDDTEVDASVLESLLDCCKGDLQTVKVALDKAMLSEDADLMELIGLNDIVLEVVQLGEEAIEAAKKKAAAEPQPLKPSNNLDLDINGLIRKKDVFSLICILRAQSEQRLDAALALMEFARDGESPEEGGSSLRGEIRSSGGMHSLLQVFRAKGTSYELRVVAGMAVAYVLPSFVESSPGVGLKIMECLRFLSTSRPVSPNGVKISQEVMFKASAMGVTSYWMNALEPMLNSGPSIEESATERSNLHMISNSAGGLAAAGGIFDQGQQTLELQELLEMTVSLIVHIEKHCESESVNGSDAQAGAELSMWRYTNVEQVCTVDVARPIAVREGLLPILVEWIKSNDKEKVRPAVSALRYLTSIKDKYMAGWIHSQMVNEGALSEVVKLADDYNAGHDVRLAVAQILASLCVAPHTRAAVVEARCMYYLIGFLYDHSDPASEEVALYAGRAITQLAAGAITRASVFGEGDTEFLDFVSPDKRDSLVDDIVNSGAIGSFIAIALENEGQLRAMAIEAIRVLSEDRNPNRRTRLQFVEDGAAKALGRALQCDVTRLSEALRAASRENEGAGQSTNFSSVLEGVFLEVHDALCGLANILEPIEDRENSNTELMHTPSNVNSPQVILNQGCMETAESGGLISLLKISTMSLAFPKATKGDSELATHAKILLREACRSLSSLSPLLLTGGAAEEGYASWAASVLNAFNKILAAAVAEGVENIDQRQELFSVLCGLDALATSEPLKIRMVDKTLSSVVQLKNSQGDQSDVANVAGQVFYSLGFAEDEIAVQVAGSNPNLLADWFCLRRSLILQAMVRAETRKKLASTWRRPLAEVEKDGSVTPRASYEGGMEGPMDALSELDLFDNFADDEDTIHERDLMVRQYSDIYDSAGEGAAVRDLDDEFDATQEGVNLLAKQVYPFNDERAEIDWILSHERSMYGFQEQDDALDISLSLPQHVETFLDCCLPSRLLRNHILPVFSFRPEASFNYRAIMMPQRQYFSFRREGQMVSRLCDIQPEALAFDDVHWSLGFTNSTFAGEFSESLVQALYLSPTIRGVSFARDIGFQPIDAVEDIDGEGGSVLLAKLVGSLPPWIDFLTFKNIFCDHELRTLIAIIETMGKLSADQDNSVDDVTSSRGKGRFWSFSITHSPQITGKVWQTFFSLLGRTQQISNRASISPLSSLMFLDLSWNDLGDAACALILDLVHDSGSGCNLEQLDLSGNRIEKGSKVVKVLRAYVDKHRFIPIMERKGWGSRLHTLNLSSNNLGVGQADMDIITLLRYNALGLKVLDLSDNAIYHGDDDYYFSHGLASALRKNTILCQLNLSRNKLSSHMIDDVLERLLNKTGVSRLSFFGIEDNAPPISSSQRSCFETFLTTTRAAVLRKAMSDIAMFEEEEHLDEDWVDELKVDCDAPQLEKKVARKSVGIRENELAGDSSKIQAGGPRGDNMITVLFSAPLVFTDDQRNLRPFKKLDFDMERELMWQCMKEASRDIELSFDNATHDRLLAAMTKRCSCLHYSGHGHQMYLPFEDGSGGPNWFKVDDIRSLIAREGAAPFKFVFVSACHSGLAGETFASAGVPHVVCCQQEFELKDTAALAFTRQFYLSLAIGHTVKESFEQGRKAVRATPNLRDAESEMKKFLLLPKDGDHDVPIFNAASVPEWPKLKGAQGARRSLRKSRASPRTRSMFGAGTKQSELGVRNMMQEDPSPTPPQFFLGREVDMYFVLKSILSKRLVSVVGESGVGRSSIVCAVCHYINERASTIIAIEKIFFVKAKQGRRGDSCRSLLEQLQRKLVESEAGKGETPERGADMEDMFEFICNSLKNEKALLVFDRMELLENSDDAQEFPMFLSSLFRGTKNVKVLLTGRRQLGIPSLGGQVESPIPLGPLNFENTVRLFANLCPYLHTEGERYKLYQRLVTDYRQALLRPFDEGVAERTKTIFAVLGDGVPSKIEKAAYDMTNERLHNLVNTY